MCANRSMAAFAAASADAGLVTSSSAASRSSCSPTACLTVWVLRPVATTAWPAASAALARSTPIPRPAPVMSHTFMSVMSFRPSFSPGRARSGAQERLDRAPFVHRLITLCGVAEREIEVEDFSWVDLPVPDQVDQLRQEAAHWGRPAVEMREAPEHVHAGDRNVVGDADEADVPAGAGGVECLHHRLLRSDRLNDGVRAESVG